MNRWFYVDLALLAGKKLPNSACWVSQDVFVASFGIYYFRVFGGGGSLVFLLGSRTVGASFQFPGGLK